jgi:hypothetical protein
MRESVTRAKRKELHANKLNATSMLNLKENERQEIFKNQSL